MKSECYNFLKHKLVPRDVLRYSVSTEFDMSYKLIIIISDLLTLPKEKFFFLPYFYVHLKFLCIWKAVLFLIYIKAVL